MNTDQTCEAPGQRDPRGVGRTHPVTAIDPGAIAVAGRHQLPLRQPPSSCQPLVMSASIH
jgi:hypothetical protein